MSQIIFLNGTSSAGKTSIAKKLQEFADVPFLHIGIDTFFFMLHPRYIMEGAESELGYQFIRVDDEEGPKLIVKSGTEGKRISHVMRRSMKALEKNGLNLIIDEVLFSDEDYWDYLELFEESRVIFVAVKPPVEVAESREKARGDRVLGLARGLYPIVYPNKHYDLEIDSSRLTPEASARQILEFAQAHPRPQAFQVNLRELRSQMQLIVT